MPKSPDAFRTISEVADWLGIQAHVLRFWESKFSQIKPVKRAGGRRYYRPADMLLIGGIKKLLHDDGLTIKDVQTILKDQGTGHVSSLSRPLEDEAEEPPAAVSKPPEARPLPGPGALDLTAAAPGGTGHGADDDDDDDADDAQALPETSDVWSVLNTPAEDDEDEDPAQDAAAADAAGEMPAADAPANREPAAAGPELTETAAPQPEPAEAPQLQTQLEFGALEPAAAGAAAAAEFSGEMSAGMDLAAAPDQPDAAPAFAEDPAPAPQETPAPQEASAPQQPVPQTLADDVLAAEPDRPEPSLIPGAAAEGAQSAAPPPAPAAAGNGPGHLPVPPGGHVLSRLPEISHIPAPVRGEVEACAAELRAWLERR